MDLKEADLIGDAISTHWYYRSKAAAMTRLLDTRSPSVVLDVGAGSAYFSRYLLRHGAASEAWCVDISYERESDEWEDGKPLHLRKSLGTLDAQVVLLMTCWSTSTAMSRCFASMSTRCRRGPAS